MLNTTTINSSQINSTELQQIVEVLLSSKHDIINLTAVEGRNQLVAKKVLQSLHDVALRKELISLSQICADSEAMEQYSVHVKASDGFESFWNISIFNDIGVVYEIIASLEFISIWKVEGEEFLIIGTAGDEKAFVAISDENIYTGTTIDEEAR